MIHDNNILGTISRTPIVCINRIAPALREGVNDIAVALIGAVAIAAGLAVYALFRPARIPLIPSDLHFAAGGPEAPALLGAVPSLLHAFAMPLLTAACLGLRRRHIVIACLAWAVIGVVFEFCQRSGIRFLARGTFDPFDLLCVLLGATLAAAVGLAILRSSSR